MCEQAVEKDPYNYRIYVPKQLKTQEMCEKVVNKSKMYMNMYLMNLKPRKCVNKLLKRIQMLYKTYS